MSDVRLYKEQKVGNGANRPIRLLTLLTTPQKEIVFSVFDGNTQLVKLTLPEWDARALRKALDQAINAIK